MKRQRKTALWKDAFREVRKTKSRFFSIFLIVALGAGFFAGIKATGPDMKLTGDAYFDEQDVFHFGEKELRLADVREFERQAAADSTWIWGNGKGLASE